MALAVPWSQIGQSKGNTATHARGNQYSKDTGNSSLGGLSRNQYNAVQPYMQAANTAAGAAGWDPKTGTSLAGRMNADQLNKQLAYNTIDTNWQSGWLNKDYGPNRQLLDLDIAGNNIDRAAAQRLLNPGGVLDTQQTGIDRSRGLLSRELANQMRGYDIDDAANQRTYATNTRNMMSDQTARGAVTTEGARDKTTDLVKQLWEGIGQVGVGREGARIGNERGDISLNNQQADLTESKASAKDRVAQYDLKAQQLGINGTQLKNQLQKGLEQLKMTGFINADMIMDKLNSNSAEDRQLGIQIYNQALDYGGYFPR